MKKILVVDDEQNIVKLVETRLKANGYQVISAMQGSVVEEMVANEKPDLIILDLMLPGKDGYSICDDLKNSEYANIPIIMLTAKVTDVDRELGGVVGADAYITKPFEAQKLLDTVKSFLD